MRALLLGLVVVIAGCAGSRPSGRDCDPSTSSCEPDAALPPDAPPLPPPDAAPDGPPLRGFGEACTDGDQCASDVCILAGIGGICSQLCGECPDGYGCFGVMGAIDPDSVSFVCVPTSTQLCSPCQADHECTLLGMDKCLAEPTGRSYCSRDCSSVACPTGYTCDSKVIDDVPYKQCVPQTNACDCQTADQMGASDACSITTPLGTTCAGTSQCGGTAGWGACQPPSQTDDPDGTFTDDNCDGIDGDITKGVFVSGSGSNAADCGAFNKPCQTITFGISRAVATTKPNVYVQAGTYNEVMVVQPGISIWGGYDFQWHRGPYTNPQNRVTVIGKRDTGPGGDGEYLTVRAHEFDPQVTIADMVLQGPDAQGIGGSSGRDGRSSYVVHVKAAFVSLLRVQIVAGAGATGGAGGTGADAPLVDAQSFMNGGTGQSGAESASTCNDTSRGGGGGAGTNSCSGGRNPNGGGGGRGGTKDTNCGVFSLDFTARPGDAGSNAGSVSGLFGLGGHGGTGGNSCGGTADGGLGVTTNGASGAAGSGGYLAGTNVYWYARAGGTGGTGDNGSGGGGGGGGGGCDNGEDAYGAGGNGGAAGGCAARGGGTGGGGGGGSFGIVAVASSTVSLQTCELFRGTGGAGGAGGAGGRGQSAGVRSTTVPLHPGSAQSGFGGAAGHGGHGGGGAGGGGGRSAGILTTPDSTVNGSCSQSQGGAGASGTGGPSAPNAPAADRDGNAGSPGAAGSLEDTRTCVNSTSC